MWPQLPHETLVKHRFLYPGLFIRIFCNRHPMTQITPYQNIFASPSLNPHDLQGLFIIVLNPGSVTASWQLQLSHNMTGWNDIWWFDWPVDLLGRSNFPFRLRKMVYIWRTLNVRTKAYFLTWSNVVCN